jgi:molybdenum cofactor synthesis domain-containing protein
MRAALLTVGDELLAGDIENTNATWLARRLSERGVRVIEMATVPDDVTRIADAVDRLHDRADVLLVTGGVGGTPDDVTMDGVAAAFGCDLSVHPEARESVEARVAELREERPGFELDVAAWAAIPEGADPLANPEGLSPGARVDGVYVLPGVPSEMKAMFETVTAEFDGDAHALVCYARGSESDFVSTLRDAHDRFDVAVGCYPGGEVKRIKVTGTDPDAVEAAYGWLLDALPATREDPD